MKLLWLFLLEGEELYKDLEVSDDFCTVIILDKHKLQIRKWGEGMFYNDRPREVI